MNHYKSNLKGLLDQKKNEFSKKKKNQNQSWIGSKINKGTLISYFRTLGKLYVKTSLFLMSTRLMPCYLQMLLTMATSTFFNIVDVAPT